MAAHSLHRLTASLYNRPHLITPEAFQVALEYLHARNGVRLDPVYPDDPDDDDEQPSATIIPTDDAGMGWVCVDGSLTYKPVSTLCGDVGTSYQSLVAQFQELADAGVKTIVMEVTSGGGEGSHCFETADEIRSIADENGITLLGYADTCAASAAYALICVCDQVIANPSAILGSIGCVIALWDTSKAMAMEGYKPIYLTSGSNKVPYADDGSFKQAFLDDLQEDVDQMNAQFEAHVNKYTGIPVATIDGFQAATFSATESVTLGLADAVMTNKQFAAYAANVHKETQSQ